MAGQENTDVDGPRGPELGALRHRVRGYDRAQVDAELARLRTVIATRDAEIEEATLAAEELRRTAEKLRFDLADANDAAARASESARVFDHIVRLARETAAHVVADARLEAADIVADAHRRATGDAATDAPAVADIAASEHPAPALEPSGEAGEVGDVDLRDDGPDEDADGGLFGDVEHTATRGLAASASADDLFGDHEESALSFGDSAAMELFDEESAEQHWTTFAESDAGRAFFADESIDARARRWILTG